MKTATCVLIHRDGKFLAISRRNDTTRWGLPGGKVDKGETNVEGAQRELYEETGLDVFKQDLEPIYVGLCPGKLEPPVDYWVTTYLQKGKVCDNILFPEEGFELRWLTAEELCDPAISPFADYNQRALAAYSVYSR